MQSPCENLVSWHCHVSCFLLSSCSSFTPSLPFSFCLIFPPCVLSFPPAHPLIYSCNSVLYVPPSVFLSLLLLPLLPTFLFVLYFPSAVFLFFLPSCSTFIPPLLCSFCLIFPPLCFPFPFSLLLIIYSLLALLFPFCLSPYSSFTLSLFCK